MDHEGKIIDAVFDRLPTPEQEDEYSLPGNLSNGICFIDNMFLHPNTSSGCQHADITAQPSLAGPSPIMDIGYYESSTGHTSLINSSSSANTWSSLSDISTITPGQTVIPELLDPGVNNTINPQLLFRQQIPIATPRFLHGSISRNGNYEIGTPSFTPEYPYDRVSDSNMIFAPDLPQGLSVSRRQQILPENYEQHCNWFLPQFQPNIWNSTNNLNQGEDPSMIYNGFPPPQQLLTETLNDPYYPYFDQGLPINPMHWMPQTICQDIESDSNPFISLPASEVCAPSRKRGRSVESIALPQAKKIRTRDTQNPRQSFIPKVSRDRPLLPKIVGGMDVIALPQSEQVGNKDSRCCAYCRLTRPNKSGPQKGCANRSTALKSRCDKCESIHQTLGAGLGADRPRMTPISFMDSGEVCKYMNTMVVGTVFPGDALQPLILCHFEPLVIGRRPCQLSHRSQPLVLQPILNPADEEMVTTRLLDQMRLFMRPTVLDRLHADYRNEPETGITSKDGVISNALQCAAWYGVLANLRSNRIFEARGISTHESKHALYRVVDLIVRMIQDLLKAIADQLNDDQALGVRPAEGICALFVLFNYINSFQTSGASIKRTRQGAGKNNSPRTFEEYLHQCSKSLLQSIKKYKQSFSAFFCCDEVPHLQRYINLMGLVTKPLPLLNITLEKSGRPLFGFGGDSPLVSRSLAEIMKSSTSAIEDLFFKLDLSASHEELDCKSINSSSLELTVKRLDRLQLTLGEPESPFKEPREEKAEKPEVSSKCLSDTIITKPFGSLHESCSNYIDLKFESWWVEGSGHWQSRQTREAEALGLEDKSVVGE